MTTSKQKLQELLYRWSYASSDPFREDEQKISIWRTAYNYWVRFARALGKANAVLLLSIVYIVLIGPAAIGLKLFGKDLLDRKIAPMSSFWKKKEQEVIDLERSKQQF